MTGLGKKSAFLEISAIGMTAACLAAGNNPSGTISFNEQIQPILSQNCYPCHGSDKASRKGELRLDRPEFAFAPRKNGPVIVREALDQSPLIQRIESNNDKFRMPPPEAHTHPTAAEVAVLRRWVLEGAEYQDHWAYI